MLEQIIEENVPRNTTYMMNTPQNKKDLKDLYSDERSKALNAASSFGKGKMISESEKMIMEKKPKTGSFLVKKFETVKVPVKKSIKAMKKPM